MRTLWQVFQHKSVVRTDAQLLHAFVQHKSEEAFTDLVHRHGSMVLGVCQRILGHSQDAEDAFQATFLVLAQKAAGLLTDRPLSPWLFGVARRVAMKARSRRPAYQQLDESTQPEPALEDLSMENPIEWSELRPIIDEELAHLPEHYRHVLILCQLHGLTKPDAARQLGCPEGTVSSRLMRAREMLQGRLLKRGIALSSLTVLDSLLVGSPVSAQLAQSTISLGMKVALGTSLATGVSSSVVTLAQGASQAMMFSKLQLAVLTVAVATGLSLGTSYVAGGWGQDKNNAGNNPAKSSVKPRDTSASTKLNLNNALASKETAGITAELSKVNEKISGLNDTEMQFDEYLNFLEKETGLPIIIDSAAFRDVFVEFNQKELRQQKISLPRMSKQTTNTIINSVLDSLICDGQRVPATFLIRQGSLVIVPKSYLNDAASKIQVNFDGKDKQISLYEALEQLSKDTGISIILDPRSQQSAYDTKINTSFRSLKLINAVRLLANMADLTVINIDGALYVATPDNCKKMEEEMNRNGQ